VLTVVCCDLSQPKSTFECWDRFLNLIALGKGMVAVISVFGHLGSTCLVFSGGVLLGVLSFELFVDISPSLSRCALKIMRDSIIFLWKRCL
jgi:hypothetical protein